MPGQVHACLPCDISAKQSQNIVVFPCWQTELTPFHFSPMSPCFLLHVIHYFIIFVTRRASSRSWSTKGFCYFCHQKDIQQKAEGNPAKRQYQCCCWCCCWCQCRCRCQCRSSRRGSSKASSRWCQCHCWCRCRCCCWCVCYFVIFFIRRVLVILLFLEGPKRRIWKRKGVLGKGIQQIYGCCCWYHQAYPAEGDPAKGFAEGHCRRGSSRRGSSGRGSSKALIPMPLLMGIQMLLLMQMPMLLSMQMPLSVWMQIQQKGIQGNGIQQSVQPANFPADAALLLRFQARGMEADLWMSLIQQIQMLLLMQI